MEATPREVNFMDETQTPQGQPFEETGPNPK